MIGWAEAGGISLRYRLQGNCGARAPLVLLHEMGGCLESWDALIEALGSGYCTLSFDARGAGLSEKPLGPVSIGQLAADLARLLDALNLQGPMALCGCAVGAAVALKFAAEHPRRVERSILLSPATGVPAAERPRLAALAERLQQEGMRARVLERFEQSYAAHYFAARTDRAQVRGRLLQADPASYAMLYRMLCDLDLSSELSRITRPTLVLAGRHDATRPPAVVEAVARAIPAARFEVLESGHAMHILTPGPVAQRLRDFLD